MAKEHKDIDLRPYNSFGVSQLATRLVEFDSYDDLHATLTADPTILAGSWRVLGGGNNTLFTADYDGTLIHPISRGITITAERGTDVVVRVEAGEEWDDVVAWAVEHDLWGIENLSLIPGQAGAAPVQNIGAYGTEAKDTIESVELLCTDTLNRLVLGGEYCSFGYRESIFKHQLAGRVIITAINLRLSRTASPRLDYGALRAEVEKLGEPTLSNIRKAVISIRESKLPDPKVLGNGGSFFKNPIVEPEVAEQLLATYPDMPHYPAPEGRVKLASGWLIEQAGWKGRRVGNVGVHDRQALVLVNHGGATGGEVMALARQVVADVKSKFGIEISPEINIVG